MAKGVKKIRYTGGMVYPKLSTPNAMLVVSPDSSIYFAASEWLPGTTEADKKKELVWMQQTTDRKVILKQKTLPATSPYGIIISRKLAGSYCYYIEASFSGKRDSAFTGLFVRAACPAKVVSSQWALSEGGANIKNKEGAVKYGNQVHLHLETEGINGHTLLIEVYNRVRLFRNDTPIKVYTNVQCISGEVNLTIKDTYSWMAKVNNLQDNEQFYIKVKDAKSNTYLKDDMGQELHAVYLNIKNEVYSPKVSTPQNNNPSKVGAEKAVTTRYEPCKFIQIDVVDITRDKGHAKPEPVILFEEGKTKITNPKVVPEKVARSVFFDFDQSAIRADAQQVLSNILQFLLEHSGSTIHLDAHADDRGTDEYNQVLSQKRADIIKKFFVSGGLDGSRIIPIGHGEKDLAVKGDHLTPAQHQQNRRTDIRFTFNGHNGDSLIYEAISPSSDRKRELVLHIDGFDTKKCFTNKHNKKEVRFIDIGQKIDCGEKEILIAVDGSNTVKQKIYSDLSANNVFPIQYIWPKATTPNKFFYFINSCRYYTNPGNPTVVVNAYPDIKWTLEFKWNHTEALAYSYGTARHPHDLKTGRQLVARSMMDTTNAREFGEMSQSFELGLEAEWNEKSQKVEVGKEFGEKIAKTLGIFIKMKKAADFIVKSPVNGGKVKVKISAPVIAVAVQWQLERPGNSNLIGTSIEFGMESKPLLEVTGDIDLWQIFYETGANAVCPGAGAVLKFISEKMKDNLSVKFLVKFGGSINIKGQVKGNTLAPKDTKGTIEVKGKVQVGIEFKATAAAEIGYAGFDASLVANVDTAINGGYRAEIDKTGICGVPFFGFEGIIAKYVAVGTVKWGFFKRTFSEEGEYVIVEPWPAEGSKQYILGPYK